MHSGTIKSVRLDGGYGFISRAGEKDIFFHRTGLAADLPFDETLQERCVTFDIVGTVKGDRANNVRPAP